MTRTDSDYETADLRNQISQGLVWWKIPQEAEDSELLRWIMSLGAWEVWQWARNLFSVKFFIEALTEAKYGDFSSGSWHYWHIRLRISPVPRCPKIHFLGDGV